MEKNIKEIFLDSNTAKWSRNRFIWENINGWEFLSISVISFFSITATLSIADRAPFGKAAEKYSAGVEVYPTNSHFVWEFSGSTTNILIPILSIFFASISIIYIWNKIRAPHFEECLGNRLETRCGKKLSTYVLTSLQSILLIISYLLVFELLLLLPTHIRYCTLTACSSKLVLPRFPFLLTVLAQGITLTSTVQILRTSYIPEEYGTTSLKLHLSNWWRMIQLVVTGWFSLFVGASLSLILNRTPFGMKMVAELGFSLGVGLLFLFGFTLLKSEKIEEAIANSEDS